MNSRNTFSNTSTRRILLYKDASLISPGEVGFIISQCFRLAAKVTVNFLLKRSSEKAWLFSWEQCFICCILNVRCLSIIDKAIFNMHVNRKNNQLAGVDWQSIIWLDFGRSFIQNYPGRLWWINAHVRTTRQCSSAWLRVMDAAWRAGQCPGASGRGFDVKVTSKQNLKKFYNNRRKWSLILF